MDWTVWLEAMVRRMDWEVNQSMPCVRERVRTPVPPPADRGEEEEEEEGQGEVKNSRGFRLKALRNEGKVSGVRWICI